MNAVDKTNPISAFTEFIIQQVRPMCSNTILTNVVSSSKFRML